MQKKNQRSSNKISLCKIDDKIIFDDEKYTKMKVNVIDGNYKLTYGEPMNDWEYFAVIVKGPSGSAKPKGVEWFNDKPTNLHETTDRIFIP